MKKFMNMNYKLGEDGKTPILTEIDDFTGWEQNRTVRKSLITSPGGDITVSTVFLMLDHSHADGPPILFETMIFGGEHDMYQDRYSTWDEAVEGHQVALDLVQNNLTLENL